MNESMALAEDIAKILNAATKIVAGAWQPTDRQTGEAKPWARVYLKESNERGADQYGYLYVSPQGEVNLDSVVAGSYEPVMEALVQAPAKFKIKGVGGGEQALPDAPEVPF